MHNKYGTGGSMLDIGKAVHPLSDSSETRKSSGNRSAEAGTRWFSRLTAKQSLWFRMPPPCIDPGTIETKQRVQMTITLTEELGELIREKVARGEYDSADAFVGEAVQRLVDEEKEEDAHRDQTLARIQAARAEIV